MFFMILCIMMVAIQAQDYHSPHSDELLYFEMKAVDLNASGSYGLRLHDIDNDGNTDLLLTSNFGTTGGSEPGEVYWYRWDSVDTATRTPKWTKYLIARKQHVIHASFLDVNADGWDDVVFNSNFELPPDLEDVVPQGSFWCALNPGTGNYEQEWELSYMGRVVGNHRTAAGDFDGDGFEEAIAIPLFSPGEEPYYGPVDITVFEPPRPWSTDAWTVSTVSSGFFINPHDVGFLAGPPDSVLLPSHQGIHRMDFSRNASGSFVSTVTELHGYPEDTDTDVRDVGFKPLPQNCDPNPINLHGVTALPNNVVGLALLPYLAVIDYTNTTGILPGMVWHGDQVSVYFPADGKTVVEPGLTRKVLEKRYSGGHATAVYDFDGDGCVDVMAGFRDYPTAFMLYRCVKDEGSLGGVSFRKQIISERGTNDIVIDDFDKDGYMDVATVGSGKRGDGYVMLWLYRPQGVFGEKSEDCDENLTGLVVSLVVAGILLIVVVGLCGYIWVLRRLVNSKSGNYVGMESDANY